MAPTDSFAAVWWQRTAAVWILNALAWTALTMRSRLWTPVSVPYLLVAVRYAMHYFGCNSASWRHFAHGVFLSCTPVVATMARGITEKVHNDMSGKKGGSSEVLNFCLLQTALLVFCFCLMCMQCGAVWRGAVLVVLSTTAFFKPAMEASLRPEEEAALVFITLFLAAILANLIEGIARQAFDHERALMDSERSFVALTAHEVRNPLNAVAGYLQLFLIEVDRRATSSESSEIVPDEPLVTYVQHATTSTRIAVSILENLNDLRRIEAGMLSPAAEPIDLANVLRDAATIIRPRLSSQCELRFQYEPALAPDGRAHGVLSDEKILTQIIANLGINAAKFTSSGYVELSCRARSVEPQRAGTAEEPTTLAVCFSVRDSGAGIHEDVLPTIFDRYTTKGGLGLGLYLARLQVDSFNPVQRLSARSPWTDERTGAEFSFELRLPCSNETMQVAQSFASAQSVATPATASMDAFAPAPAAQALSTMPKSLRVLIADDQKINRMLLEMALRKGCCGAEWDIVLVQSATAAFQAVVDAFADAKPFDLIIVDEIFSDDASVMRGSTAVDQIREHESHVRSQAATSPSDAPPPRAIVVSCTGNAAYEADVLLKCGADDVWGKYARP